MEDHNKKSKIKLLFVCTMNSIRSPTAEYIFRKSKEYEAKSVGLDRNATVQISYPAIQWADRIFVMDEEKDCQKYILTSLFPEAEKKDVQVLNIPDDFSCPRDKTLIRLLKTNLRKEGINI